MAGSTRSRRSTRSKASTRRSRGGYAATPVRKRTTGRRATMFPGRSNAKRAKKRSTYTKRPPGFKSPGGTGAARRELSVFHNAFSNATAQPRIPDGKAGKSLGDRSVHVSELRNRTAEDMGDEYTDITHILMYAGLSSGAMVWNTQNDYIRNEDSGLGTATKRQYNVVGYNDFANFNMNDEPVDKTVEKDGMHLDNESNIARWRLVSQAMKLKLINPDETNDGWWEAIRMNEVLDESQWMITTRNSAQASEKNTTVAPTPEYITTTLGQRKMATQPSYANGRLKDIQDMEFHLHPNTDEFEFKVCSEQINTPYKLNSGATVSASAIDEVDVARHEYRLKKGNVKANRLLKEMIDWNQDMVYMRIHNRPNTSLKPTDENPVDLNNGASTGSRFILNLVANHEIIYQGSELASKYHIEGLTIPNIQDHSNAKSTAQGGSAATASHTHGTAGHSGAGGGTGRVQPPT